MPEIKPQPSPWEEARALIADHVHKKFCVADADPMLLLAEFAYDVSLDIGIRMDAAKTLVKITRPQARAVQVDVSGTVNHDHQHRAAESRAKAFNLLEQLSARRYASGQIVDGDAQVVETVPAVPAKIGDEPTQH